MNLRKERKEASSTNALHCQHNKKEGLCKSCSDDLQNLSGGLDVAKDAPAFQRAERKIMQKKLSDKIADDAITEDSEEDSETLSGINDADVDSYIHNKEVTAMKKIIWEKLNKEYLQEQVFKEAIAAAEKRARDSSLSNSCPEDVQSACRAVADLKAMKEKTHKKAIGIGKRPATPSQPSDQIITKKRLSSKINYDVLDELFGEPVLEDKSKRNRIETTGYEKNDESKEDAVEEKDTDKDNTNGGIVYEDYDEEDEDDSKDYY